MLLSVYQVVREPSGVRMVRIATQDRPREAGSRCHRPMTQQRRQSCGRSTRFAWQLPPSAVSGWEIQRWKALTQLAHNEFERRMARARRDGNISAAANLAMDFDEVCACDA